MPPLEVPRGIFTTVIPGTACCNPIAPVGFGFAFGKPPSHAHDPIAMLAAALLHTSRAIDSAVRPPIVQ